MKEKLQLIDNRWVYVKEYLLFGIGFKTIRDAANNKKVFALIVRSDMMVFHFEKTRRF